MYSNLDTYKDGIWSLLVAIGYMKVLAYLTGEEYTGSRFAKNLSKDPQGYSKLRGMISPFMLRRMKTDKRIISNLPDQI